MRVVAKSITRLCLHYCPQLTQIRRLSAHEAAVALRPFYFAVHPDRFGLDDPKIRIGNEKALQVNHPVHMLMLLCLCPDASILQTFNGYLNGLFPYPTNDQKPVKVNFAIRKKDSKELEKITIELTGGDAGRIIR